MRYLRQGCLRQQLQFIQHQYLQDGVLPFGNVLSEDTVSQALTAIEANWNDRIYTPLVTLWVFLSQVISADHSCRGAVARLVAHRAANGLPACSSNTGAYCQARNRLPEKFFSILACLVGRALDSQVDSTWLWKGRRVYMFDGSTLSMPDTPANQKAYPQNVSQKPGLGFPIARIGAITSLSCGAIISFGFCRYAGKGQGEVSLLRKLWTVLSRGDVLLADSLLCNWTNVFMLKEQGFELVSRMNKANRKADFRKGVRLGKDDHIVQWRKPNRIRSLDWPTYHSLPDYVTVRETRIRVSQRGFRSKTFVIVTTLLNPKETTKEDLAFLYRERWHNELDLRSIKVTLQMDILRCKTPDLVHKEVWTHILAYNLIRTLMAQSAMKHRVMPRAISFKAALQSLEAFHPVIAMLGCRSSVRLQLYEQLLDAVVVHRVANRPDRFEPRLRKRRPKAYDRMMRPRQVMKREMLKGVR